MKQKFLSLLILFSTPACFAIIPDQTISIKNNTNQPIDLNLTIPKRTAAVIAMTKLKSAQEMLHQAILNDSAEGIREAVSVGANVNLEKDGKLPIILAVLLKKNQAVEELLKMGSRANVNYLGQSLVKHALKLRNIRATTLLVRKGASFSGPMDLGPGYEFDSQNIVSYIFGRLDITQEVLELLQEIIDHGFDLNDHTTLNHYWMQALKRLNIDVLNFLIKNNADINQTTLEGGNPCTPLLLAVYSGNSNIVRLLLEAGADINKAGSPLFNYQNVTPLAFAIKLGNAPMVEMLLKNGAR